MKTLDRYLRRELLGSIGLVLTAFVALFAVFDFLGELDERTEAQGAIEVAMNVGLGERGEKLTRVAYGHGVLNVWRVLPAPVPAGHGLEWASGEVVAL